MKTILYKATVTFHFSSLGRIISFLSMLYVGRSERAISGDPNMKTISQLFFLPRII